jgi:hypothetical protein
MSLETREGSTPGQKQVLCQTPLHSEGRALQRERRKDPSQAANGSCRICTRLVESAHRLQALREREPPERGESDGRARLVVLA